MENKHRPDGRCFAGVRLILVITNVGIIVYFNQYIALLEITYLVS